MGSGDDLVLSPTEQTLTWMIENGYHYTKIKTTRHHQYNLFDCRDENCIRFIASFRTLSHLVKYVNEQRPFC
jgi:hypothetical protein